MENSGASNLLRNRSLGSHIHASAGSKNLEETSKIVAKEWIRERRRRRPRADDISIDDDDDDDDDEEEEEGWFSVVISWIRILACFGMMMITTLIWGMIVVVLLPWPYQRIRQGNLYGHVTGRLLMWILGNPIKIEGSEYSKERAIYISNHASPLDIFLVMWLTPTGTVGIAKKEIIWYPLFGQLYVLANHLRIDRSNQTAAIESMNKVARAIMNHNLSLIIFPEGTRSKSGQLLPFKKGFVHMALKSRLPIVPIVLSGTHLAWRKDSLHVRPTPLTVKYLPPIRTDDWTVENIDDYVRMVHEVYVKHLPKSQKPAAGVANLTN